jgi:hypothetical protein
VYDARESLLVDEHPQVPHDLDSKKGGSQQGIKIPHFLLNVGHPTSYPLTGPTENQLAFYFCFNIGDNSVWVCVGDCKRFCPSVKWYTTFFTHNLRQLILGGIPEKI